MDHPEKQTKKYLLKQWEATLQKTIELSKDIISGTAAMSRIEVGLTISKTLSKPNFRTVFKGEAGEIAFSVVKILVSRFIDSFAFSNKLNDIQIEMLTVDTMENFNYESLEDIILFFKMARSGKFGTTKRGVDSNLIFGEWFPMYLEQKAEIREQNKADEKSKINSKPVTMEDVKKTYSQNENKNRLKKIQAHVDRITKMMDRQMLEDTIIDWSKSPKKKPYIDLLKRKRRTINKL